MWGLPSCTLLIVSAGSPAARRWAAVPRVATSVKPQAASRRATATTASFATSGTERKALPAVGRSVPAPTCALAKAAPKLPSMPITSPVDFISGPSTVSTPGNLMNGNTASLTLTCAGRTSAMKPCASSERPTMQRAPILASGTPIALLTNGTVRLARGFTSRTKTHFALTANWTFMRPTTQSSRASATVCRRISSCTSASIE